MAKIYCGDSAPTVQHQTVSSIVAVVDKIPGKWSVEEKRIRGQEGVSFMMKTPSPSSVIEKTASERMSNSAALSMQSKSYLEFSSRVGSLTPSSSTSAAVHYKVPLANTVFVNGRETTLVYTQWKGSSDTVLEPQRSQSIKAFNLRLPDPPKDLAISNVPLVPLTEPRVIVTAMGNIISEIQVQDKVVPASTELETAVMDSMKKAPKEGAVAPNTRIYALVRPAKLPESFPFAYVPSHLFLRGLGMGAGLYQVIGGGGGWGNKRGLLALDPTNSGFNASESPPAIDFDGSSATEAPKTVSNVADRGDLIQFYQLRQNFIKASSLRGAATSTERPDPQSMDNKSLYLLTKGTAWGLEPPSKDITHRYQHILIGTIPTQDSEPPSAAAGHEMNRAASKYIKLHGVFGALSEGAIQMEIRKYPFSKRLGHSEPLNRAVYSEFLRNISVPYSCIAFKFIRLSKIPRSGRYITRILKIDQD